MNTSMDEVTFYLIDDVSVIESGAKANAGVDGLVSPGSDSAWIGIHDEGMPCTWYIKGSATPIGYSGGFKVHPDTTTSYVVEMDLCGVVTYDTVVVRVAPLGVASPRPSPKEREVLVYPNPTSNTINIQGIQGIAQYRLVNMLGVEVMHGELHTGDMSIAIGQLPRGCYELAVTTEDGERVVKRVVKE